MKKNFLLSVFITLTLSLFAQTGHKIEGTIKGVSDTSCILAYYFGDKQYAKDTAVIDENGSFKFEGEKALKGGIYMIVFPEGKYAEFIVSEQHFSFSSDINDLVGSMQLIDTQENKVFYEYMQSLASKQQKSIELKGSIEAATTESEKKLHEEKLRKLGEEVSNFQETFIQNNPDAFFSKVLLANKEIELPDAPTLADGRIDSSFSLDIIKIIFLNI